MLCGEGVGEGVKFDALPLDTVRKAVHMFSVVFHWSSGGGSISRDVGTRGPLL